MRAARLKAGLYAVGDGGLPIGRRVLDTVPFGRMVADEFEKDYAILMPAEGCSLTHWIVSQLSLS